MDFITITQIYGGLSVLPGNHNPILITAELIALLFSILEFSCYIIGQELYKFRPFVFFGPPLNEVDRLCGLSSWLQIRRPGFDSRHYQKKKVVGLERGPLSLVCTTEELLDRKVAAPV
jgi:hypothetical protein